MINAQWHYSTTLLVRYSTARDKWMCDVSRTVELYASCSLEITATMYNVQTVTERNQTHYRRLACI
jgi:hypothetical protein